MPAPPYEASATSPPLFPLPNMLSAGGPIQKNVRDIAKSKFEVSKH